MFLFDAMTDTTGLQSDQGPYYQSEINDSVEECRYFGSGDKAGHKSVRSWRLGRTFEDIFVQDATATGGIGST